MAYIQGFDRKQMMMCTWDSFVEPDSTARLIDAFVDSLDLTQYGIKGAAPEGRPGYDPKSMFKLYIYGNRKGIRSSRKLAESCRINIEVKWMTGGIEPDFRTISEFRKDNIDSLKEIFHEFNKRISGAVEWGFTSVDGSKFTANNSREANFTRNKLDDRIKWLNAHTDEYLRILKEMDEQEELEEDGGELTREAVEEKLKETRERLERYEGYQKIMEESGVSQLSLTDADAKLMKDGNGFSVSYNAQTAVDSETHLIRDYDVTNQVTDHGLIGSTMEGIRKESAGDILEAVADKGYEKAEDMAACLENGIIPHVVQKDGKEGYELELPYEESEADTESTDPEELKKSLRSGKIPDAYKDVISSIEVKEVSRKKKTEEGKEHTKSLYGTEEEMLSRAKEGYFERDPERNLVYCPNGEILRPKCIKKNGEIRYSNKNACRHCPYRDKCYKGKNGWKEIDFTKDCLEKPCQGMQKAETTKEKQTREKREKVKVVKLYFKPDRSKTAKRLGISESPFGTIKRAMGSSYFLLRGLKKVSGEFALMCLGYNIERAKNLLGFDRMMELMTGE